MLVRLPRLGTLCRGALTAARSAALLLLAASALAQQPTVADDDEPAEPPRLAADEAARLRAVVEAAVPAGASAAMLNRDYRQKLDAAKRLGWPLDAKVALARGWVAALPASAMARWELARMLAGSDRRDEAITLGEQVVAETRQPAGRVLYQGQLATWLALDGHFARAERLVAANELLVRDALPRLEGAPDGAFWKAYALSRHHSTRCTLDRVQWRLQQAVQACTQAAALGAEAVQRAGGQPSYVQRSVSGQHLQAQLRLVDALSDQNRLYDAQQAALEAQRLYAGYGEALARSDLQMRLIQLRLRQQRPAEALRLADEVLAPSQNAGATPGSVLHLRASRQRIIALVLLDRWAEALEGFDRLDEALPPQVRASARAQSLVTRALVYGRFGRGTSLEAALAQAVGELAARLGPAHYSTALHRGLLGLVLASQDDRAQRERALAELGQAVAVIIAPQGLEEGVEDQGVRRLVREQVLQRYLTLLGERGGETAAIEGFRVADALRGSLVQQAVGEAAVRGAAQAEGLADIVRRDQDARNELLALAAFIARQDSQDAPRRLEGVQAQMRSRIAELQAQRVTLRGEIARRFPDYEQLVNPAPPRPAEVAARLADDEAFVSLLPAEQHVHVWAVTPRGTTYHRADLPAAALATLVQRLRATLDVAGAGPAAPAFDAAAAHTLYRALLAPLATPLQGVRHLVVAPGGVLGQLPMGVLVTEAPAAGSTPAWLVQRLAVSHVASASAWMALRQTGQTGSRRDAPTEALGGWADPLFDSAVAAAAPGVVRRLRSGVAEPVDAGLAPLPPLRYAQIPPLPETRLELLAIAQALQADPKRDARLGAQATRTSVLAANASGALRRKRVLVFATHGLVAGELPNLTQPALALAADGRETADPLAPLLTLEDVLTLRLNADWVVLSACNTAANDGQAQEALSGLARGFFYAGARGLLVTHWAVESLSATQLTTRTFAHQAQHPQARKAESLRQAMLEVMALPAYAHPAYWAPYALVGDGGR